MHNADDDAPALFDALGLIRVLNEHNVEFVVIGGFAAGVQGAAWITQDLDVVYATSRVNYDNLARALLDLDAQPVELPSGVSVILDARALKAGDLWTLSTRLGRLDLMREPAPGLSYTRLRKEARTIHGREEYLVASLDDLVAMKRHAGRPKDIGHAELLEIAAEESRDK